MHTIYLLYVYAYTKTDHETIPDHVVLQIKHRILENVSPISVEHIFATGPWNSIPGEVVEVKWEFRLNPFVWQRSLTLTWQNHYSCKAPAARALADQRHTSRAKRLYFPDRYWTSGLGLLNVNWYFLQKEKWIAN